MELSGEFDAVVIGAGVMGSATAYELAKRGQRTLLLEQFDFLHRRGSSHGESRIIRRTYPEDFYTEMMGLAYRLWAVAEEEAGTTLVEKTGSLDFGPPNNKDLQAVLASCRLHNVPHEVLTQTEVESRFPFSLPPGNIGVFNPEGGVVNATKAVATFQRLAASRGAMLADRTTVRAWETDGVNTRDGHKAVRVHTSRGSVTARRCILSAGAWTKKLVKSACGIDLPVTPLHTTVAYWQVQVAHDDAPSPRDALDFSAAAGCPVFINYDEPYIYGMPSLELPGLVKVSLHGGPECDPDTRSLTPRTEDVMAAVAPFVRDRFCGRVRSDAPVVAEACMYSMTPDQDFILDFLPVSSIACFACAQAGEGASSPVLVAAGFSGHGFKLAPLVAKIMADLALEGTCPTVPMHYFSIARFKRSAAGNVKANGPQVRLLSAL